MLETGRKWMLTFSEEKRRTVKKNLGGSLILKIHKGNERKRTRKSPYRYLGTVNAEFERLNLSMRYKADENAKKNKMGFSR